MDKNADLIKVVKYMEKQQHIMVKMLIHLGFRADLYDDFIRGCFSELENLKLNERTESNTRNTTPEKELKEYVKED